MLIDAGANADARPEHLLQFAHMGAVFAEEILEVADPEVRLLSIGEEGEKGNQLTLEAHELLRGAHSPFRREHGGPTLLEGDADVVVTDGFTGNVALKTLEGTVAGACSPRSSRARGLAAREARRAAHPARCATGCARDSIPRPTEAATCSGSDGLVVIAHGSSSRVAIANAIRLAARGVEQTSSSGFEERLSDLALAALINRVRPLTDRHALRRRRPARPAGRQRGLTSCREREEGALVGETSVLPPRLC